jgi:hypothetical protein
MVVNKDLEMMWKDAVFVKFEAIILQETRRITKISVRIVGVLAEILTKHLPNKNRKYCSLIQPAHSQFLLSHTEQ